MEKTINGNHLKLMTGDITKQKTDAIVNAANGTLLGGGGVDGAIHRAAGRELLEACKAIRANELNGEKLETGEAVMTKGFQLPANWIIHIVGPVWGGDKTVKEKQLANCYRHSLESAHKKGLTSISFPSISTGVYAFPVDLAAKIAIKTIMQFLQYVSFGNVFMVLFSEKDYDCYAETLEKQARAFQ